MNKEYRLPDGSTYLLDEADAARLQAVPVETKASAPRNKERPPRRNKARA